MPAITLNNIRLKVLQSRCDLIERVSPVEKKVNCLSPSKARVLLA